MVLQGCPELGDGGQGLLTLLLSLDEAALGRNMTLVGPLSSLRQFPKRPDDWGHSQQLGDEFCSQS